MWRPRYSIRSLRIVVAGAVLLFVLYRSVISYEEHLKFQIWDAVRVGDVEKARRILRKRPTFAQLMRGNQTLLHASADTGNTELATLLLAYGADVNGRGDSDETPLHHAVRKGHLPVAKVLVEHGADLSARNYYGVTPHEMAQGHSHGHVASYLKATMKREEREQAIAKNDVTQARDCRDCNAIDGNWTIVDWGAEGSLLGKPPDFREREMFDKVEMSFSISDETFKETVDKFRTGKEIVVTPGIFECDDTTDPKRFWIVRGLEASQYSRRFADKGIWKIEGDLLILYHPMGPKLPFPTAFPDLEERIPKKHMIFVLRRIPAEKAERP